MAAVVIVIEHAERQVRFTCLDIATCGVEECACTLIEIGALGGSILPNLLGQSKQHTGSSASGFIVYTALALLILVMLRAASRQWTRASVGAGGRVLASANSKQDVSSVLTYQ